jgi:arabinofuranosyltransferase
MRDTALDNNTRRNLVLTAVLAVCLVVAYLNRFIQDDAYISYRYAYHLTMGEGLVWNPGYPVEGYTNFLWTLLMSVPISLGRDAVVFSQVAGLMLLPGTLLFTYALGSFVFKSRPTGLVAALLLGTNYTFSAYATGGLETQLQAFLVTAAIYATLKLTSRTGVPAMALVGLSILYAAALLTRLDSAVALIVPFAYAVYRLSKEEPAGRPALFRIAAFLLPGAAILATWLVWKYIFYGDMLPNSFYAKATGSITSAGRGVMYYYHFLKSYLLFPFLLVALFRLKTLFGNPNTRILIATVLLWTAYVIKVGGDFMEFRFVVPVMPLGMALIAVLINSFRPWVVRVALAVLVIAGSIVHHRSFALADGIATIDKLHGHIVNENEDWDGVGRSLGRLFEGHQDQVTIATTAAGAIPYYSRMRTIDMLGINDKWVAKNGVLLSTRPGHQRLATTEYLLEQGVNLVIGHPQVIHNNRASRPVTSAEQLERRFLLRNVRPELIPKGAKVVEIPVNDSHKISVLYLAPSDIVDRVIESNGLRTSPVVLRRNGRS